MEKDLDVFSSNNTSEKSAVTKTKSVNQKQPLEETRKTKKSNSASIGLLSVSNSPASLNKKRSNTTITKEVTSFGEEEEVGEKERLDDFEEVIEEIRTEIPTEPIAELPTEPKEKEEVEEVAVEEVQPKKEVLKSTRKKKKKRKNAIFVPKRPIFDKEEELRGAPGTFKRFWYNTSIDRQFRAYQKHFEQGSLLETELFDFLVDDDGYLMCYRYKGTSQTVHMPSYVGDNPVMYVHPGFFNQNFNPLDDVRFRGVKRALGADTGSIASEGFITTATRVRSVVLPEQLQAIPPFLFTGCLHLKRVVIPETVGTIAPEAFEGSRIREIILLGDCPAMFQFVLLPDGCKVFCTKKSVRSYGTFVVQCNPQDSCVYRTLVRS